MAALYPLEIDREDHDRWGEVDIIVASYGDYSKWKPLADRACESATFQGRTHGYHQEAGTLASTRNQGGFRAESDWLIFLDADDTLAPGYVDAMLEAADATDCDIFKPSTLGVVNGKPDDEPVMIPRRDLLRANHIVIGAMVRRELFVTAGGFRELPALEDWDLWLRLVLEFDAQVAEVPDAVYRVHVNPNSRNQNVQAHREAYLNITKRAHNVARCRGISEL